MTDYRAAHVVNIYKRRLEKNFWRDIDHETRKRMGRSGLLKQHKILEIARPDAVKLPVKEYLDAVAENLCSNYSVRKAGAIGIRSPECYQAEMQQILESLQVSE